MVRIAYSFYRVPRRTCLAFGCHHYYNSVTSLSFFSAAN